jgi:DNA mismatch repair protein MutH
VDQPCSDARAKPRAWALKAAFSGSILRDLESGPAETSLEPLARRDPRGEFEGATLTMLHEHAGKTLGELSREFGVRLGAGKSAAAVLVRGILGLPAKGRIREFERFGIETKTVPLSPLDKAYEAMSFPNFNHMELALDEWDGSELRGQLNRLLILPIIRERRASPKAEHRLSRAFFWSPTDMELEFIAQEWEMFRAKIAAGLAERLPKPRSTTYIHVRTKGKNSRDCEPAPGATTGELLSVTKKCFWLNKRFVEQIVAESGALRTGPWA